MNNCFNCIYRFGCEDFKTLGCSKSCLWFGSCDNCDCSSDSCLLKGE